MNFSRNFYLSSIVLSIFIIGFCIANPRLEEPGDIDHLKKFLNLKKTLISCCGCCAEEEGDELHPFCSRDQQFLKEMCQTTYNFWVTQRKRHQAEMDAEGQCVTIRLKFDSCSYKVRAAKCFTQADRVHHFSLIKSYGISNSFYRVQPTNSNSNEYKVTGQVLNYTPLADNEPQTRTVRRSSTSQSLDLQTEHEIPTMDYGSNFS